jgi:hypothetical protein
MESFICRKAVTKEILGRAAWRDTLMANESRREITNPYFPGLRCGQWLFQGVSRTKQILALKLMKKIVSKKTTVEFHPQKRW